MTLRWNVLGVGVALAVLSGGWGCKAAPLDRTVRTTPVDTGLGSVEATRRAFEGSWSLASLQVLDAAGGKRPVKATGLLQYDAYGNMKLHGQIDDPALQGAVVLDYEGRIVIDVAKHRYYAAALSSDKPVNFDELAAVAPDKVREYEISADRLVITYLDASSKPTAITEWHRTAGAPSPPDPAAK